MPVLPCSGTHGLDLALATRGRTALGAAHLAPISAHCRQATWIATGGSTGATTAATLSLRGRSHDPPMDGMPFRIAAKINNISLADIPKV